MTVISTVSLKSNGRILAEKGLARLELQLAEMRKRVRKLKPKGKVRINESKGR